MSKPDNVNFTDIVKQVAKKTCIQQKVCKKVIEGFEQVVIENVEQGKRVVVRSFGAFYRRDRKPSVGRNVHEGGSSIVEYGAKKQLAFRAIPQFMDI